MLVFKLPFFAKNREKRRCINLIMSKHLTLEIGILFCEWNNTSFMLEMKAENSNKSSMYKFIIISIATIYHGHHILQWSTNYT